MSTSAEGIQMIVNPGGYVGESTQREIAYARAVGKPITFTDLL